MVNQLKKVHSQLKQKIITFMDWVAYHRGLYGCSSPSTKVLRGLYKQRASRQRRVFIIHQTFLFRMNENISKWSGERFFWEIDRIFSRKFHFNLYSDLTKRNLSERLRDCELKCSEIITLKCLEWTMGFFVGCIALSLCFNLRLCDVYFYYMSKYSFNKC